MSQMMRWWKHFFCLPHRGFCQALRAAILLSSESPLVVRTFQAIAPRIALSRVVVEPWASPHAELGKVAKRNDAAGTPLGEDEERRLFFTPRSLLRGEGPPKEPSLLTLLEVLRDMPVEMALRPVLQPRLLVHVLFSGFHRRSVLLNVQTKVTVNVEGVGNATCRSWEEPADVVESFATQVRNSWDSHSFKGNRRWKPVTE